MRFTITPLLALVALALLTVVVYATHVARADWVYEDANAVLNTAVQGNAPIAIDRARWLSLLSHKLVFSVLGESPVVTHAANLGLHVLNGVCIYMLIATLAMSPAVAVLAVGLFWLHPVQSEAVAYAASRSELLSTSFALLACVLAAHASRWFHHVIVWMCVALALSAKESTIVVIPLLAWLALIRGRVLPTWQLLALAVPGMAIAASVIAFDFTSLSPLGRFEYAATQATVLWRYLALIVVPVGQTIDHDFDFVPWAIRWVALAALGVTACLCGLLALQRVNGDSGRVDRLWYDGYATRSIVFGVVWALIALSPRFVVRVPELMTEHHLYFPFVGLSIAMATVLVGKPRRLV